MSEPLLEVRDLRVTFLTDGGDAAGGWAAEPDLPMTQPIAPIDRDFGDDGDDDLDVPDFLK